jgi:hypothetical protein
LGTPPEDVPMILQEYVDDARALENQLIQIAFYMRGGCPLDQAYKLTNRQRKNTLKFIEENIERTNKTGVMMH